MHTPYMLCFLRREACFSSTLLLRLPSLQSSSRLREFSPSQLWVSTFIAPQWQRLLHCKRVVDCRSLICCAGSMATAEYDLKGIRPAAAATGGRDQAQEGVYEKLVHDHAEGSKELAAAGDGGADPFQSTSRGTGLHSCCSNAGAGAAAAVERRLQRNSYCSNFRMPMHYPRYSKADYEAMPEWRLDLLFREYGLPVDVASTLAEKREYAMGVFLWGSQNNDAEA